MMCCSYGIDEGSKLTASAMNRVLSLLPSATEIVAAIGAEESLVGITHECDYPPAITATKPTVTSARINPEMPSEEIDQLVRAQLEDSGTLYALDLELVRQLRPTHVLTQQLCTVCAVGYATVHAAMRSLPHPPEVINLEPRTLEEVFGTVIAVGELLGRKEAAERVVAGLQQGLAEIPRLPTPPRTLFLEWLIPPFRAGHWMPELVRWAGGTPVLCNEGSHSTQVSWEAIRAAEFEAFVISCCGFSVKRTLIDVEASAELQALRAERPSLRVIVMDGNHYFSRPGPRLVESAQMLNAALQGLSPESSGASIPVPYSFM